MRKQIALALAIWAGPGAAQEAAVANGAAFGNWEVACDAVSSQQVSCRLVQTQTLTETGALVLRMLVYPQPDGAALLIAQMPMGVYLPSGAVFRPEADDASPVTSLIWQRCLGEICEAALLLDADATSDFVANEAILFAYQMNPGEERRVVPVDLQRLAEGLEALRAPE